MAKTNKKFIIQLLVTLAVIAIIIPLVEWKESYNMITSINLALFGVMLAIMMIDRWLMAFKWVLLLRIKDIHLSNLYGLKLYLIGGFWGEFLPTGVGVDVYRVIALKSKGISIKEATSSIVVERVIGFFATTTFAFFAITYVAFFFDDAMKPYLYPIFYALIIPVLLSLILIRFPVTFHISQLFNRYKDTVIIKKIKSLYCATMNFKSGPRRLWYFYCLSFVEQAIVPVFIYFGALALGLEVNFFHFLAIVPAMFILIRIPVSIQGIGVEEGLFILFFSMVGLSTTEAFSLALVNRVAKWTIALSGGAIHLVEKIKS
jgi:uncharacterized protein (TIRG00374 family)